MTHNEAVQIFITAGNTVRMKVQHGAYAELMVSMFNLHSLCNDECLACVCEAVCGKSNVGDFSETVKV